ncbi:MAG: hypothetical protein JSS43_18965 [Proteobacteria bacterium]|nr:hypothetical protein [Pseudomonadota bacterium]
MALAVAEPKPPMAGVVAAHAKSEQQAVDTRALWLWGRLRDFERQGVLDAPMSRRQMKKSALHRSDTVASAARRFMSRRRTSSSNACRAGLSGQPEEPSQAVSRRWTI